ncbi:1,4-dihydroxy-2-naphthoate octaprenyltransferase [Alginatibacterium sediminis]|uniref:1,4-dihydroxy-2-naphthoate octaprenyltransferase n=1 Tax=Alginatibacterium sediminis TaxID=2164068 RepID=A0A420E7X4_9ALTE|nr:1,4-dihydroxy-2-naphthoate octaprenyltransferase [Alginatibacterium sediminis]
MHAARLRTLPLASGSVLLASALAASQQQFQWSVFLLSLCTALLLQILSNLANDYGDAEKGTDDETRLGPKRAIQAGLLSAEQMLRGIKLCALAALVSGLLLLKLALGSQLLPWLFFIGLGAMALVAAVAYTMGKRPYGYQGYGDIAVFTFFGLVSVLGTYYLHTQTLPIWIWGAGIASGALATMVLNINNIRDLEPDKMAGKTTFAVKLGLRNARLYHLLLLALALVASLQLALQSQTSIWSLVFLFALLPLSKACVQVLRSDDAQVLDRQLPATAKAAFLWNVLFSIGLLFT